MPRHTRFGAVSYCRAQIASAPSPVVSQAELEASTLSLAAAWECSKEL